MPIGVLFAMSMSSTEQRRPDTMSDDTSVRAASHRSGLR
jgi:hypothetical protein